MKSRIFNYSIAGAFIVLVFGISIWSWVLVDTNFTLVTHADWTRFRELAVSVGYFQRQWSANAYTLLILMLTLVSVSIVRWYKGPVVPLLVFVGLVCGILSYPALSHDLFNYIFDARIITHYHANPYLHSALDFPADPMLRFMHWVHRSYPYGPTYLLISLVPSILGMGVFSLTFLLFKTMHVVLFVISGYMLHKMDSRAGLIFISSPLIIVEGLINTHNDFVALALAIIGIYVLQKKRSILASIIFLISGLIKFISLPIMILSIRDIFLTQHKVVGVTHRAHSTSACHPEHDSGSRLFGGVQPWHIAFGGIAILIVYLLTRQEIQPWYFLNFFIFLPFAPHLFEKFTIFFTGLLLSYYPYVVGGEWGQGGDVGVKRSIIVWGVILNGVVLASIWIRQKFQSHKRRDKFTYSVIARIRK